MKIHNRNLQPHFYPVWAKWNTIEVKTKFRRVLWPLLRPMLSVTMWEVSCYKNRPPRIITFYINSKKNILKELVGIESRILVKFNLNHFCEKVNLIIWCKLPTTPYMDKMKTVIFGVVQFMACVITLRFIRTYSYFD